MNKLREEARKEYVKKRKVDQLALLESDIVDNERLFEKDELTEKEIYDIEYQKKVLSLAKEHIEASKLEKVTRYQMPKENENVQDLQHYSDDSFDGDGGGFLNEQKRLEKEKLESAMLHFGAKDFTQKQFDVFFNIIFYLY